MKISDFTYITRVRKDLDWTDFADITVTTGYLWWKKSRRVQIFKVRLGSWQFLHNGGFTPGFEVDRLARADEAKRLKAENQIK